MAHRILRWAWATKEAALRTVGSVGDGTLVLTEALADFTVVQNAQVTKRPRQDAVGNGWIESEHGLALGTEADGPQATLADGALVLGKASYATDTQLAGQTVDERRMAVRDFLKTALAQGGFNAQRALRQRDRRAQHRRPAGLDSGGVDPVAVAGRAAGLSRGRRALRITGTFRTTDASDEGRYCFMLTRKSATGPASYHYGFGIAWKKSLPSMDTRTTLAADADADADLEVADATGFPRRRHPLGQEEGDGARLRPDVHGAAT